MLVRQRGKRLTSLFTIEQHRRIGCHDNNVKAKDASSRVRDRSWNITFYFIYLPTIKDVAGYYKFRNEVMVWFMRMMICYNVYIPLQMMWRKIQVLQYFISLTQNLLTLVFFSQVLLAAWHF